jgi:hypothetical protein
LVEPQEERNIADKLSARLALANCANNYIDALADFMGGRDDGSGLESALGALCEEAENYSWKHLA